MKYSYVVLIFIFLATIAAHAQIDLHNPKPTMKKPAKIGKCTLQALLAATEWPKKLLEERISKGQPLTAPISFEIGMPYLMDKATNPPGIMEREWVPIKTKSKDLTREDHIGLHFDSSCNRNLQSENEAGKKTNEFLKEKSKKNSD